MFEGFILCRWLLEPRKASRLCKWVHTTQEFASFSNAQCTFHSSTCPLLILTQHPHYAHPLLREYMRPDLDAWHPLWRGSQHAWWSCLQVLCLPFLTLISRVHEETWFQSICLFFILPLTMAWTAGTDATKESQCLGLNLSTVMETLGMDRWDKTGYYVFGFIKICNYLFFLIEIARCQSALLHLLPLHLRCLLTGFLRPWYVTNGHWPLWKFEFNFFYNALLASFKCID